MNTAPIKRTLSVTGLLLAGAVCGVGGTKLLAPQWLAPAVASASLSSTVAGPVSVQPGQAIVTKSAAPTSRPVTVAKAPAHKAVEVVSADELEARRRSLVNQLLICRSQLELYKLQHHDKLPEFSKHPAWSQLTQATRGDGTPDLKGSCGPYLQAVPVNPVNGFASLGLVRKDPTPGQVMPGEKLGFVFCPTSGHLFGTGVDGKTIFDDGAVTDAAVGGTREAKAASLKTQLQTLRSQLELYKLQHVDLPPDFEHNPGWEQMTRRTRSNGTFDLRGFGPYTRRPVNALNGFFKVETAANVPASYKAKGQQVGYVFETATGRLFATDEQGAVWRE
jgi:hypothetical protein